MSALKKPALRAASEAELGRCRRMLPHVFPAVGRPPECIVAGLEGEIVGASALAWVPNGFVLSLHVEPGHRRRGVGRALVSANVEAARGETAALRPWQPIAPDSDAARFLTVCGFVVQRRLHVFEADPTRLRLKMAALLARMAPRIPVAASLVPPEQVAEEPFRRLLAAEFSLRGQQFGAAAWDQDLSRVLRLDDVLVGAVLARRNGGTFEVDFNVVAPGWRGGWANVMLVEAVLRNGHAAGLTRLRFLAEPHVRDTVNLARRAGALRLPDHLLMALPL